MALVLPDRLEGTELAAVPAGTVLHRVHHDDYPHASFNPCRGEATRFAPLFDGDACIATVYAATSLDGAAYETMFRGTPSPYASFPRQALADRAASEIAPRRALALVPLFSPELLRWGLTAEAVFSPNASVYPGCRALALRLWRAYPQADGLIWPSVRDTAARTMLLWLGRVGPDDFDKLRLRRVSDDPSLLDDLARAGRRAGFVIAR